MEKKPTSGLAVASLVTGIIALFSAFVPLFNLLSFPFVLLAVIFGIIGIVQSSKGKKSGKGLAITGLVLGVIGLLVTFAMYFGASDTSDSQSSSTSVSATETTTVESDAPASESAEQSETSSAAYAVTIDSCRVTEDYQGNPVAVITYGFTNNSDDATSFAVAIMSKVFQNGVELDSAIGSDWDSEKYMSDIKPGASTTVELGYELEDSSDITVEVEELFSFSDELIAEKTFSVA